MSETSSHESFYDSLSDVLEDTTNAEFFPELSAFLSQEEINKSLDLAREAIANSELEDFDSEKEITQIFKTSPSSLREKTSQKETKLDEQMISAMPQGNRPTQSLTLPEQESPVLQNRSISSPTSKRKPTGSPLLTASPSYIRSLRSAERRGPKALNSSARSKLVYQGSLGSQSQLRDKAANLIEELSSIFREAAKPRNLNLNGESSSPDSGYLSPKNQPSILSTLASQSPTEDYPEMETEVKLPKAKHINDYCQKSQAQSGNGILHEPLCDPMNLPAAPRFTQKLRSQEVAEGSRVYLECRVMGNPTPQVRDPSKIQQLQNQIRLEQEGSQLYHQQSSAPQNPPPSPPFPPPPSFQELEASQSVPFPDQMNVLTSHSSPTMQPSSSFNYARPKQFIAAQNISPASGYVTPSSSSSTSSLPSPMSPTATQKQFGRVPVPPFSQPFPSEGEYLWSPSSPSPPPPPPPVFSPNTAFPMSDSFPLPPPPPPPLPGSAPSPSYCPSPNTRFGHSNQTPAAFLSSMLPSQPTPIAVNALGLPKSVTPVGFPKKTGRTARIASDEEIQGTKDAVIQDLERKLRFKEDLLNNGQPKLTYEERMARRLLGADSATVFNIHEPEEDPATQEVESLHASSIVNSQDGQKEYKVSSCEQRLISEIEYRLERSPLDDSGDESQQGDGPVENGVAPYFEMKLKHYKIFEGMPVTFTCRVAGNPKPKIYWFKDGKQISARSDHYSIQKDPDGTCSLHTTASTLDDDGNYTILAANPQGRVSCTGRLMVQAVNQRGRSPRSPSGQPHVRRPRSRSRDSGDENEPIQERFFRPHFLQAPGDLTVQEGKLCRMDCKVSGLPTPDLSWQLDGKPIRPDNAHKMLVRENGVHSLIIEPVTSRDAGIYTCVATNRAGQNSFSLELIVAAKEAHHAPAFLEKLQNTGVADGYPVRLECRVSGVPPPQIFWKKENESLTYSTDRVSMHQDNHGYICLLIQGATKEDAGWYTVSAKNEAGIVSCTARLDVYTQWHQQPQSTKPKKVRPSASRYAALSDQGLDIKAAFQPEANPSHLTLNSGLVESDDL
ncbi:palladin isoform X4 [Trichosurus vulpecula]|uniref:palladin isoform X4 n=1 Tax=Trichosurus vulpecula TaxID=9337 RepID=UPI00186AD12B|nr:palladin isoform X4 [Trichosurus vulpecula]